MYAQMVETGLKNVRSIDDMGAEERAFQARIDEGINIEYCYGTLSRKGNAVSVILDVSDIERAVEVLKS